MEHFLGTLLMPCAAKGLAHTRCAWPGMPMLCSTDSMRVMALSSVLDVGM